MGTNKFFNILFLLVFGLTTVTMAQTPVDIPTPTKQEGTANKWNFSMPNYDVEVIPLQPYAEVSADEETGAVVLTFKYGEKPESDFCYSLNEGTMSPAWSSLNSGVTKVVFEDIITPTTCAFWFYGMKYLTSIENLENLHTENVTDMTFMFADCSGLTTLDVSNFNTEKVENMSGMFYGCSGLTTLDVSNFNTGKVENMSLMFYNCSSLTTLDLTNFSTTKVKGMENMFNECSSLTTILVGSSWNTENVVYDAVNNEGGSEYMFNNCTSLIGNDGTTVGETVDKTYAHANEGGYLTSGDYKIFYQWADESPKTYHAHTPSTFSGAAAVAIDNPDDREGYNFAYWTRISANSAQIGGSSANLEIAAGDLGNRIYVMNWTLAKYQVDFETEYGTAPESQTVAYGEKATKPENPTDFAHDFQYWQTADSKPWDFENSTVSNSLTLTAVWQPKNFVANFYNGSTFFSSSFVAYGSSIETPSITPEKEGHTFLHWALTEGGDEFEFETETMPANDVNLYAQWEKNKYMVYLPKGMNFVENTVSANASGEIVAEFEYGTDVSFKLDNGYILQEGSSIKYHTSTNTDDITLTATGDVYTVTVPADNVFVTSYGIRKTLSEDVISSLLSLTKEYDGGIYAVAKVGGNKLMDSGTNLSYSGTETNNETITIHFDHATYEDSEVGMGKTITVYSPSVDGETYTFTEGSYTFEDVGEITPKTLTANFADDFVIEKVYDGTPDLNADEYADVTVPLSGVYSGDDVIATISGGVFSKAEAEDCMAVLIFRLSGTKASNYTMSNATVNGYIRPVWIVTFKDGNEVISTASVVSGSSVERPTDPTKIGHNFFKWTLTDDASAAEYNFSTEVASSIDLYAQWNEKKNPPTINAASDLVYSGAGQQLVTVEGEGKDEMNIMYKLVGQDYSTEIPEGLIGEYVVYYKAAETENYKSIEESSLTVKIKPAPLDVASGFEIEKVYDGTTDFNAADYADVEVPLLGVYDDDEGNVTAKISDGVFSTAEAGTCTVALSFTLSGTQASNYTMSSATVAGYIRPIWTVTFKNGDEVFSTASVVSGSSVELPSTNPTKEDNKFLYWGINEYAYDKYENLPIVDNTTLYAKWEAYTSFVVLSDNSTGTGKTLTFKYDAASNYNFIPDEKEWFDLDSWGTFENPNENITKVVFEESFQKVRPTSCEHWFYNMTNLEEIVGLSNLNTSEVKDMRGMFSGCGLTSIDLSSFNTGNVTNMNEMFVGCGFTSLNLSGFDTKKVEDMYQMFGGCTNLTVLDLSSFNTEKVEYMERMFKGCEKLTTIKVGTGWKFGENFRNGYNMFESCSALIGNYGATVGETTDATYAHANAGGYLTTGDYKIFYKWADVPNEYQEYTPSTFSGATAVNIDNPEREGHTFDYWQRISAQGNAIGATSASVTIAAGDLGNRIYTMHWAINQYDVEFETEYGEKPETQIVNHGEKAEKPADPVVASHEFQYWQTANNIEWIFDNTVSSSLTLTAVWQPKNFVANFYYNETSFISSVSVVYGSTLTPIATPTKPNHKFLHWALTDGGEKVEFDEFTMPAEDVNFYAQWKAFEPYAVISENSTGKTLTFKYGEKTSETGDTYDLNTDDESYEDPDWSSICTNITKVVFDESFKEARPTTCYRWFNGMENLKEIEGLTNLNTSNVTQMDLMFLNCSGLTTLDLSNFSTGNVKTMGNMFTLCSGLTTILIDETKWNTGNVSNSGSTDMFYSCSALIGNDGTKVGDVKDATKAHAGAGGYLTKDSYKIFYKWADDETETYKTQYTPSTFTFSSTNSVNIENPDDREGYTFDYWERTSAQGNAIGATSATVSIAAGEVGNRIYTMHWTINQYDVEFETEYGEKPETQTVTYGEKVTEPTAPTVASHEFQYWQTADNTEWIFDNTVSSSLTLTAVWQPKNFVANFYDGTLFLSSTFVAYGSSITTPSTDPTKTGHNFLKWTLTDDATATEYDFSTLVNGNTDLYAQWELVKYTVNFYNGSTLYTSKTVDYGSTVSDEGLRPEKEGHVLLKWTLTDSPTATAYAFTEPVTEDMNLYAQWFKDNFLVMLPQNMEFVPSTGSRDGFFEFESDAKFKMSDGYKASEVYYMNDDNKIVLEPDEEGIYTYKVPAKATQIYYEEKKDVQFTVSAKTDLIYNGSEQNLVTVDGEVPEKMTVYYKVDDGEYKAELPSATDAKDYVVWYKADETKEYNAVVESSLTVTISSATITAAVTNYSGVFDYAEHKIGVEVTTPSTGYTVKYSEEENGTYEETEITKTDVGNYTIYYEVSVPNFTTKKGSGTITITEKSIEDFEITLSELSYTYDGTEKTPTVIVKDGDRILVENTDFSVVMQTHRVNIGNYAVIVNGKGNYSGRKETSFEITEKSIEDFTITLSETSYDYDGTIKTPSVTVSNGDRQLIENTDYVVTMPNSRVNAGEYTVTFSGKGNYTGEVERKFVINKIPLKITANDNTIVYGDEPSDAGVIYSGFITGQNQRVLKGQLDFDYTYSKSMPAGYYKITPKGYSSDNYEITYGDGTLKVKGLFSYVLGKNAFVKLPVTVSDEINFKSSNPEVNISRGEDVYNLVTTENVEKGVYTLESEDIQVSVTIVDPFENFFDDDKWYNDDVVFACPENVYNWTLKIDSQNSSGTTISQEGKNAVKCIIEDENQNVVAAKEYLVKLDKTAPVSTAKAVNADGIFNIALKTSGAENYFFHSGVQLLVEAGDKLSGMETLEYSWDNEIFKDYDGGITLPYGKSAVYVRSKDVAGNLSEPYFAEFTVFEDSKFLVSGGSEITSDTIFYSSERISDMSFSVDLVGNSVGIITDNDNNVLNFSVTGNTITIGKEYLKTLLPGINPVYVHINPLGDSRAWDGVNPKDYEYQILTINLDVQYIVTVTNAYDFSLESDTTVKTFCPGDYVVMTFDFDDKTSLADYITVGTLGIENESPDGGIKFRVPFDVLRGGNEKLPIRFLKDGYVFEDSIVFSADYPSERTLRVYDDVLAIDNFDGRFVDSCYQWYIDNKEIDSAVAQFLDLTKVILDNEQHIFTVSVLDIDGSRFRVCPDEDFIITPIVSKRKVSNVKIYPNPAVSGQAVYIELQDFAEEDLPEMEILIYNQIGGLVEKVSEVWKTTEVVLPSGFYSGVVVLRGQRVLNFKVVVE